MSKKTLIIFILLVVAGIIGRILPHPWNMTPVTALLLFSSVYLGARYSIGVLFVTMLATDLLIGFYQWEMMISVYVSFALASLIGLYIRNKKNVGTVFLGTLASSLIFFGITNWAVWQFGTMYEHSFTGLMQSYFMALPFLKNAMMGDLFYSGLFFGMYELYRQRIVRHFLTDKRLEIKV